MKTIPLTMLAGRLERAIRTDVGMKGLMTLLYGWKMKNHIITDHTFTNRAQKSGEAYLTELEAKNFSQYCGYDLTRD
jgi:hypothetical protein